MSITLVNDGFSIQTIFIKGSKPCENIKALVRADGFHPKESEFNIVNVFKTGTKKDVIQLEYCRDNGDGTYELDLVIREGNFRAIVTYYEARTAESLPFKVITNQVQMLDAKKDLYKYQFFATEKSVSKSDFLTALHTIFLFKTQGSPSTARRTLTERELSCIVKHFFGDADTIDSGVDFENFLKWFEATTDVLREEPYNELFVKGFIFAPLDSETVGTLLGGSSTNNPGTFFLMCSLKEQGKVGIVLKNAGLKIVRRPLVCCSKTAAGVAASLNMYEELSTITKVSGSKVEAFDKEVGLNELISRDDEEEEEEGEFTGVPFVI